LTTDWHNVIKQKSAFQSTQKSCPYAPKLSITRH